MADAVEITLRAVDRATNPVRNVANAFRGVESAARAASAAGARFNAAGRAIDANTGRFVKLAGAAESAGGAMGGLSGGLGGLIGGVTLGGLATNAIMGIVGAAKSAAAAVLGLVASFAHGVVEAAAFMDQSLFAFKTLLKGTGDAKSELRRVIALAAELGLPVEDSIKQFQKLLAMQFKPDQAAEMLKLAADLRAVGADAEGVQRALTAITQIKAKGRLQSEELVGQLAEAGVSTELVLAALSKQLGRTTGDVRKLLEAGKITADQGIEAIKAAVLAKVGGKKLGQAGAEAAMSTLTGMRDVFKARVTGIVLDMGERIGPTLKAVLGPIGKDILSFLESPDAKAGIDTIVSGIKSLLGGIQAGWPMVKEFLGGFVEGLGPLKDMAKGFSDMLGPALKAMGIDAKDAASGARLLGQGVALVVGGLVMFTALVGGVVAGLAGIGVAIGAGVAWLASLAVAVTFWVGSIPARIDALIGELWSSAMTLGTSIIDGMVAGITGGLSNVVAAVKTVATSAITSAKTTLGIASPSKVFEELGGFATAGFEAGLERGTGGVVTASSQMAGSAAAGAAGGLGGGGGSLVVNMPVTIDGAGKSAPEIVDELQRTFMANLASAFRQLQAEAGA